MHHHCSKCVHPATADGGIRACASIHAEAGLRKFFLTTTIMWGILIGLEEMNHMIAYRRGSHSLAGAASLKYRMPAVGGTFSNHLDIAQWKEQQPDKLCGSCSNPDIRLRSKRN